MTNYSYLRRKKHCVAISESDTRFDSVHPHSAKRPTRLYPLSDPAKTPCKFAFVILSHDDQQLSALHGAERWRARQNVILELGWFMHRLGRWPAVILHKGAVEILPELLGVFYLSCDKSIFEAAGKIRERLSGVKLI